MSSNITIKTIVYFHEKKWLTTALIVFAKIHINISRNLWKRIKHFKASKIKIFKKSCTTKWPNYRSNVSLTLHIVYCDIRKVIYKEWHYFCKKKISDWKSNRKWHYFDIVYLQVVYTIFHNFFYFTPGFDLPWRNKNMVN